jgi:hypothetical protein
MGPLPPQPPHTPEVGIRERVVNNLSIAYNGLQAARHERKARKIWNSEPGLEEKVTDNTHEARFYRALGARVLNGFGETSPHRLPKPLKPGEYRGFLPNERVVNIIDPATGARTRKIEVDNSVSLPTYDRFAVSPANRKQQRKALKVEHAAAKRNLTISNHAGELKRLDSARGENERRRPILSKLKQVEAKRQAKSAYRKGEIFGDQYRAERAKAGVAEVFSKSSERKNHEAGIKRDKVALEVIADRQRNKARKAIKTARKAERDIETIPQRAMNRQGKAVNHRARQSAARARLNP